MLSGLSGKFEMSVDAKGRVTLPSAFRKQLAAEGTKSIKLVPFSGCLNGFTEEGFKQWVDGLFNVGDKCYNPRDAKDVRLHDGLWQSAITIDLDSAGRVALGKLSADKRERLGLSGDVIITGLDDHFAIWNAEGWHEKYDDFDNDLDALMFG